MEGGILRPRTEKLLVGSRDCTKVVDGVLKRVALVEETLLPGGRPEGQALAIRLDASIVRLPEGNEFCVFGRD